MPTQAIAEQPVAETPISILAQVEDPSLDSSSSAESSNLPPAESIADPSTAESVDLDEPSADEPEMDWNALETQITSVSQLSDVQPTDWAYTALQSLVERYGCIVGYPDATFRGNRALTRYEFAAGLNACLDRMSELIASGLADTLTQDDLVMLQRLQDEFAAELEALRGRVDELESRVAEVEANQFSTTTKLNGEVIFSVIGATGAYPGGDRSDTTPAILSSTGGAAGEDAQITLNYRTRLNLTTSFTGRDALITGLQAFNFLGDPDSLQGTLGYSDPTGLFNASSVRVGTEPQFPGTSPQDFSPTAAGSFELYKLLYVFPVADQLTLFVGPSAEASDAYPAVSPFVSDTQGAISRFAQYNAAQRVSGGTSGRGLASAAGFIWTIADWANLTGLYASVNAALPNNDGINGSPLGAGLFNGSYVLGAQLTLQPSDTLDIALNYANSYHQINILATGLSSADIGSVLFTPNTEQLDAVGGNTVLAIANEGVRINSIGGTVNWQFIPDVSLVLSGAYLFADLVDVDASTNFINWMVGLHFQDVFAEGNSAGILFGQPLHRDSVSGDAFNPENAEPYHLEGYLSLRLSDNITVTPGVFAVFNPEGYSGNDTAVVGVVRTAFTF